MEKLVISEERTQSPQDVSLITLRGTIDATNASGLEEALERIINDRCYRIVVDLNGVTYVSSAGWGIFISEIKRIRRNGGDIKLVGMVQEVQEVFELLEFNSILKPFDSTAAALRDFERVDTQPPGDRGRNNS